MNIIPDPDKVAKRVSESGGKKAAKDYCIAGLICAAFGGGDLPCYKGRHVSS